MNQKIRWGILSTARINHRVIPGIRASRRSELRAVASRDQAAASRYAAEWNIPTAYGSYDDLLADPAIDAVYIPLPNGLHKEWAIRAMQAGKHVLCEKPLALTVADVDEMAAAAHKAGVVLLEAFMYRANPQTQAVQELIGSGVLGELHLLRGSFSFVLDRPDDVRWKPDLGGGALWDVGCYPVSYSRMLTGLLPEQVFGAQASDAHGVDHTFAGGLRFAGGLLAQVDCSFSLPVRTSFEIHGTRGSLYIPTPFNPTGRTHITLRRDARDQRYSFRTRELYQGEVEDMVDAIQNGARPHLSLSETRDNIATLCALYESARSSTPVIPR